MKTKILNILCIAIGIVFCSFVILSYFDSPTKAQTIQPGYAFRIAPVQTLPATCLPANGSVVALVNGAGSVGIYNCEAVNTWVPIGTISNQFLLNQGVLVANRPFIQQSVTWNNGAVAFTNDLQQITNTASAAGSLLKSITENGLQDYYLTTTPSVNFAYGGFLSGPVNFGALGAPADGRIVYCNDCTIANPCAGAGTGAIAKRLNGAWVCN